MLSPGHFRDMNQPFNALLQFDESAIIGNGHHLACNLRINWVAFFHSFPGMGQQLFVSDRNPLPDRVEIDYLDGDFIIQFDHFRGVAYPSPGEVGDMQQSIHSTEVDKHAKVGDILDGAFHYGAHIHFKQYLFPHFRQAFFNQDLV